MDRNRPPETFVTQGPEISANPERPTQVFYQVHLYWRGEDQDGTIQGFRYAVDDTSDPGAWRWTTKTDSVFRFQAGEVGAKEHLFLIRAVDNLGKQDATPDTLRFESFTIAQPVVVYDTTKIVVENDNGTQIGLGTRDTVLVNSRVKLVWTGSDADGEIVSWESFYRNQEVIHARSDTTREIGPLDSNRHQVTVRAVDDAGAKSTEGGVITIKANFDPKTTIRPESIISTVHRPWISGPDSTLVTQHFPPGGPVQDTIPFGASLEFEWDSEDPDGPVVRYLWRVGGELSGEYDCALVDECTKLNTQSVVVCSLTVNGIECFTRAVPLVLDQRSRNTITVRGVDVYNQVEGIPTPVNMYYNFAPTVEIADSVTSFPAGELLRIWFSGDDVDSDPTTLTYTTKLDDNLEEPTSDLFVEYFLTEVRPYRLVVTAFDQSGADRPSVPDTLRFDIVPPVEPRRQTSERGQRP